MIISNVALPVGVLAVVQFYLRMKEEAKFLVHEPLSKLLSFKAIILLGFLQGVCLFFPYWRSAALVTAICSIPVIWKESHTHASPPQIIFDILTGAHVLKGTKTMTFRDLSIGLPSLLITFEQMLVSIWFHFTFGTGEYEAAKKDFSVEGLGIWRASANALNSTDLLQGFVYAMRLLIKGVGPRGNGSWRRSGGYNKLNEHVDVHLKPASEYGASRTTSNTSAGYADRWVGDDEQGPGVGAEDHNVLLPNQPQMPPDYQA